MYLTIIRSSDPVYYAHWCWSERVRFEKNTLDAWEFFFRLEEGSGFLSNTSAIFDHPTSDNYDPARCGAFADWLDDNKERLLEPHTDLRAEAEERLDSLIRWLRSGLQVEG